MKKKKKYLNQDPNKQIEEDLQFYEEDFLVKQMTTGPHCFSGKEW